MEFHPEVGSRRGNPTGLDSEASTGCRPTAVSFSSERCQSVGSVGSLDFSPSEALTTILFDLVPSTPASEAAALPRLAQTALPAFIRSDWKSAPGLGEISLYHKNASQPRIVIEMGSGSALEIQEQQVL